MPRRQRTQKRNWAHRACMAGYQSLVCQLARFSGISVTVIHFNSFYFESVKLSQCDSDGTGTACSLIGTTSSHSRG